MKATSRAFGAVAMALMAGLLLAMLSKLIYDLFNGYAVIPNVFAALGLFPSPSALEGLQFVALAVPAFLVGNALLKRILSNPGRVACVSASPWVALCLGGIVNGRYVENRAAFPELNGSSILLVAAPLLMTLAVPFGLWLAYRKRSAGASQETP